MSLQSAPQVSIPRVGMLATVRNRRGVISAVEALEEPASGQLLHLVTVEFTEFDGEQEETLLWEREVEPVVIEPTSLPRPDAEVPMQFEEFVALQRACRWSAITPFLSSHDPSQRSSPVPTAPVYGAVSADDFQLVPLARAMKMPRVSLLLADDVGLGKTIEAGLILAELIRKRRIRKVLIITPAALRSQWQGEMEDKFSLGFDIIDRNATHKIQKEFGLDANPWRALPRIITSYHYLRQPDVLEQFEATCRAQQGHVSAQLPWDLLIVDEAHNLMPSNFGEDSDLAEMLRRLTPWFEHRLFLTATPHNGYTRCFSGLLEQLDPVRFTRTPQFTDKERAMVGDVLVRRLKREINEQDEAAGRTPRFANRYLEPLPLFMPKGEKALSAAVHDFCEALKKQMRAAPETRSVLNLGGRSRNSFAESTRLHAKWRKRRENHPCFADRAHPFLHQGSADLNTYKIFLEQSHALLRNSGRLGMIVPSGIYSDKGSTALRELFLGSCDWQWLFGFENRLGIFDIHRSFKFCPIIVQKGGETKAIRAAFMHRNVDDWVTGEEHVLAYPRTRVEEFSPYSKALLEIRSDHDLRVLQRIRANGVLLGDQSERGWGAKYATEFHMTNDSRLFPSRIKWEEKGYRPDQYGHWLLGPWRECTGEKFILQRDPGLILSRDGKFVLHIDDMEGTALPLYQGAMVHQFDWCSAVYERGAGQKVSWRPVSSEEPKVLLPQFLMDRDVFLAQGKFDLPYRFGFRGVSNPTNQRTFIGSVIPTLPCGNMLPFLGFEKLEDAIEFSFSANSLVTDYFSRNRISTGTGAVAMTLSSIEEVPQLRADVAGKADIIRNTSSLSFTGLLHCRNWTKLSSDGLVAKHSFRKNWAVAEHERIRRRAILDALAAHYCGFEESQMRFVCEMCDLPIEVVNSRQSRNLNSKGFWRVDKGKNPELRQTVLALIAFHDLLDKGIKAFLSQNDGEGWMVPETLRLADFGLGHDDRAREHQPVASRLGPRFFDWQLNEDIARSWEECEAHAELIRRIVPVRQNEDVASEECNEQQQAGYQARLL